MIYGTKKYRGEILNSIRSIAKKQNMEILFAGAVGSISRGISTFDSDYDIKCLFLKKDSKNIFIKTEERHDEKKIRYREFFPNKAYNCIAFWEISAFINFLVEPFIDSGNKYELFRNTLWLLLTPYAWDPLGLQRKYGEGVFSCVSLHNEILYHYRQLKKLFAKEKDIKILLRMMHEILSIQWIKKNKKLAPFNLLEMIAFEKNSSMKRTCIDLLTEAKLSNKDGKYRFCDSKFLFNIMDYAEKELDILSNKYENEDYDWKAMACNRDTVDRILETIKLSMEFVPQIEGEVFLEYGDLIE